MSATIRWRPIVVDDKHLNVRAPSAFQAMMREAGLELPCKVSRANYDVLRGLAIAFGSPSDDRPNPFQQILDLIETHDTVELWAEY